MFDYEYRIAIALNYLNSLVDCNSVEESDLHNLMILIDPDEDDEELITEAVNYASIMNSLSTLKLTGIIKDTVTSIGELQYVCDMMQRDDPNGDYTVQWLSSNKQAALETLLQWKEDSVTAPIWLDKCIAILSKQK